MRVVVAAEAFSADLDAGRVAAAVRAGWATVAPETVFIDGAVFVDDPAFVDGAGADLVLAGLAVLDWRALRDSPLTVLAAAAARGVPCVVLAGRVLAGRRELAAIGVDAVHGMEDGHPIGEPAVEAAAAHLAARWGR